MSVEQKLALIGGVVPGVVTLVTLALAWRLASRSSEDADGAESQGPHWLAPVLVAGALVLGDFTKFGWPTIWPDDNTYRYPHGALVLGALGLLEGMVRIPAWGAWVLRGAAYGFVFWMLSEGYHPRIVPTPWFVGLIAVAGIGGAAVAAIADLGAAHLRGWAAPALVAVLFAGAGGVAVIGHLSYGVHVATPMIAFGVAAAIAGAAAPALTLERGAVSVLVGIVLMVLVGAGVQTEAVSVPSLVVLGVSPAAIGVAWVLREKAAIVRAGLAAIVLVSALGGAVGLGLAAARAGSAEEEYDPYAGVSDESPLPGVAGTLSG